MLEGDLLHRHGEPEIRQAAEEFWQDDLELGVGQRLSEALMDTVAEGLWGARTLQSGAELG